MAQVQKKFGAFSGVFTPSLLTILGVIMYMRLGWVVGEAGLIATLIIIAFAHIISFTTGLSVSSIATDKKIKTGGIYYILSRSLGLPMGGTIGTALFIGTALSISMYITGFVENFLSIPEISNFLGLSPCPESYRLVGSIILLLLAIVAFISTSLAIKTQYLILGAIILSIISIFAGFFVNIQFHPPQPLFAPSSSDVSFEYVFAIFFPAVTGFTAGVAMSGDLKNPKKDIPLGTIAAIITGFIVYIALSIGFAFFVKRELLLTDYNIAMKIAWSSPLVVAGIWGATLSSALGGILGGPRILQAISQDGILPKFLGKGYGINQEPRNALIFIALIAEGGILIGNLNAIAGIVTMFYLTSYGFINLAYVLESWASTDFRPSFRIPRWIAVVGFIFTFAIMFRIDIISMILAFVLMGGLFLLLKRRQMRLDYGDVWASVWINIMRKALQKIAHSTVEERNWQPNVILFSGKTNKRPHLIEFGKSLVGKFGMLTNFDLIEDKEAKVLFPKQKQQIPEKELLKQGIFMRRQSCRDIYEGMEMVVRTYGFAGLEPNTVIMGWARQSRNPERFVHLINIINSLDYNLLLVDYDERYGFGKKQVIDIWTRGGGNNVTLALTLAKFMINSDGWYGAKIRLLIVNYDNNKASYIQKEIDNLLDQMRINAEIKIINNEIEQKPIYDIIRQESKESDIVFIGIPPLSKEQGSEFVEKTNALLHDIGTVVLVKASSTFKEWKLNINKKQNQLIGENTFVISQNEEEWNKYLEEKEEWAVLAESIKRLLQEDITAIKEKIIIEEKEIASKWLNLFEKHKQTIKQILSKNTTAETKLIGLIALYKQLTVENKKVLDTLKQNIENEEILSNKEIELLLKKLYTWKKYIPNTISLYFSEKEYYDLLQQTNKLARLHIKFKAKKEKNKYLLTINIKKYLNKHQNELYVFIKNIIKLHFQNIVVFLLEYQKTLKESGKNIIQLRNNILNNKPTEYNPDKIKEQFFITLKNNELYLNSLLNKEIINFIEKLEQLFIYKTEQKTTEKTKELKQDILNIPSILNKNLLLFTDVIKTEILLSYTSTAYNNLIKIFWQKISNNILNVIEKTIENLKSQIIQITENKKFDYKLQLDNNEAETFLQEYFDQWLHQIQKMQNLFPDEILLINNEDYNNYFDKMLSELSVVKVKIRTLLNYILEEENYSDILLIINNIKDYINQNKKAEREIYRFVIFSLEQENNKEKIETIIKDALAKIEKLKQNTNIQQVQTLLYKNASTVETNLTVYSLLKTSQHLKAYIKKIERKKRTSKIKTAIKQKESYWLKKYVSFRYGKTFLVDVLSKTRKKQKNTPLSFLNYAKLLETKKEIKEKLPFYYEQVFSSTNVLYKDFLAGRKKEIEQITQTVEFYKQGYKGALLITGCRYDGKTLLSHLAADTYTNKENIYIITPPAPGSININDFRKAFFSAFQTAITNNHHDLLANSNINTCIIIEDLEKWWRHIPNGNLIIEEITNMIQTFGNKIFFIINASNIAYELIRQTSSIETVILENIELSPVKPEELKEIIYLRHEITGFKFSYKNKTQDHLSISQEADLFIKLYRLSYGNIGTALKYWQASIVNVDTENEIVEIDIPPLPPASLFNDLPVSWKFTIAQILKHKDLTINAIQKLTGFDNKTLKNILNALLLQSLIKENKGIYSINPVWWIHLYHHLKTIDLI